MGQFLNEGIHVRVSRAGKKGRDWQQFVCPVTLSAARVTVQRRTLPARGRVAAPHVPMRSAGAVGKWGHGFQQQ
ncbi:MAG: hypothetical protein CMJ81_04405 [Planctomycetaceae bacterium]|nr:hypothetical protein [Planctomycetaceae bacterium]